MVYTNMLPDLREANTFPDAQVFKNLGEYMSLGVPTAAMQCNRTSIPTSLTQHHSSPLHDCPWHPTSSNKHSWFTNRLRKHQGSQRLLQSSQPRFIRPLPRLQPLALLLPKQFDKSVHQHQGGIRLLCQCDILCCCWMLP